MAGCPGVELGQNCGKVGKLFRFGKALARILDPWEYPGHSFASFVRS
jgi:hypothetical protein